MTFMTDWKDECRLLHELSPRNRSDLVTYFKELGEKYSEKAKWYIQRMIDKLKEEREDEV